MDKNKQLYNRLKKMQLTPKEIKFCTEYISNGYNATQAYMTVYPTSGKNTAMVTSVQYLLKPKLKEAVGIILCEWISEKKVALENQIIASLYLQAFYDPKMFIQIDGTPNFKDWDDIPKDLRICIEGIETKYYGQSERKVIIVKLVDRNKALERLDKWLGMTREKMNVVHTIDEDTSKKLTRIMESQGMPIE